MVEQIAQRPDAELRAQQPRPAFSDAAEKLDVIVENVAHRASAIWHKYTESSANVS